MITETLQQEILRRRVLAIISHPDAGKTTITEKLLLLGKLIQVAGTVKARKSDRHARLDGHGQTTGHIGYLVGDAISLQGQHGEPAGHAGS